jgi:gamma-glutamyltranspeptidase / glutathione hydrolase
MAAPLEVTTTTAPHGMVCSIDHLASSAGLALLRAGGTAADAAIAASAVLAVTSQFACGMGGDLFAIVHDGNGPPTVLDAAGRAGSGASADALRDEGHTRMPSRGDIRIVTVPGCVDGWVTLHERYGKLPLAEVLEPARRYAADGFPASHSLAWRVDAIADVAGNDDYVAAAPVRFGTRIRRPLVAAAIEAIARGGRDAFYGGPFGEGLLQLGRGLYVEDDLRAPLADWVEPIGLPVWGHDVWTVPPVSQGYLTVSAAWIAADLALPADADDPLWAHLLVEASRQAGYDRPTVLHDGADGDALVDPARLVPRRTAIDPDRRTALPVAAAAGGTIYLCAVDAQRMGVSLIQSNADGWGAHIAEPNTRIFLHSRGLGFSLSPGHPAEYRPRTKPPHTLAPALVTRSDGSLRAVLGTMGGDSQPQVVLQLLARLLQLDQPPGRAISAPRFRLGDGGFDVWRDGADHVAIERHAPQTWEDGLELRGHRVVRSPIRLDPGFGHAHLIDVTPDDMLAGAADPRAVDGAATAN